MGWWEELSAGFKSASNPEISAQNRQRVESNLRRDRENEYQRKYGRRDELNEENDSSLLRKLKSEYTSQKDKDIIEGILQSRGYHKNSRGNWDR